MTTTVSRRSVLTTACAVGTAVGGTAFVEMLPAEAQPASVPIDRFFRDDWFGEPWRTPQALVLIHGALESGIIWYAWVPTLAQHYRVLRPDLPGCGASAVPAAFEWSFPSLAAYVASVLDKAGIESAHIVGAKTGGSVAMRFAADYPRRTRTLVVVGGPAKPLAIANPSPIPQRDRLGSNAPREMVEYWNTLFSRPDREGVKGLGEAMSKFDLAKEGVLQRISAPTLVITADRTKMHSVEEARAYQVQIPNSRLVVIRSDAYHIAAANADECLGHTLAFLKEQKQGH